MVAGMAEVKKGIAFAAALALVVAFEGLRRVAYPDPVGIPTICYGHTAGVRLGDTATLQECDGMADADLAAVFAAINTEIKQELPPEVLGATASFCYNVGMTACARSTMFRHLKAGNFRAACNELPRWVYAKGRKLNGLVRRREAERQLCLRGAA
jgi:lysozyme